MSESRRLFQPKVTPDSESRPLRVLRGKWGSPSRSRSNWRPPADTRLQLFIRSSHFTPNSKPQYTILIVIYTLFYLMALLFCLKTEALYGILV